MMGNEVHDPKHVEGETEFVPGLGILPIITTLTEEKTTEQCNFYFRNKKTVCKGYEIHMGETKMDERNAVNQLDNGELDGFYLNAKTWGTYIHGLFENDVVQSMQGLCSVVAMYGTQLSGANLTALRAILAARIA